MSGLIDQVRAGQRLPEPDVARAIRQSARVSVADMADELGVSRVTVSRWERGVRHPRGKHLRSYVDLLEALRREVAA